MTWTWTERLWAVRDARGVHGSAKAVLLAIASHAGADGMTWASVPTIAGAAGLGPTATRAALVELERGGWVSLERVPGRATRIALVDARIADAKRGRPTEEQTIHTPPAPEGAPPPGEGVPADDPTGSRGGPTARRGGVEPPPHRLAMDTPPAPEGAPPPPGDEATNKQPREAPSPARARDPEPAGPVAGPGVGTAATSPGLPHALGEAYAEAIRVATGRPWALPRFGERDLAAAAQGHGPPRAQDAVAWIATAAKVFVGATRGNALADNHAPRKFLDWLNAGAPSPWDLRRFGKPAPQPLPRGADVDAADALMATPGIRSAEAINRHLGLGRKPP